MTEQVSKKEFIDILFFAFRYAVGRNTGATTVVSNTIEKYWHLLDIQTRKMIEDEIVHQEKISAPKSWDRQTWENMLIRVHYAKK